MIFIIMKNTTWVKYNLLRPLRFYEDIDTTPLPKCIKLYIHNYKCILYKVHVFVSPFLLEVLFIYICIIMFQKATFFFSFGEMDLFRRNSDTKFRDAGTAENIFSKKYLETQRDPATQKTEALSLLVSFETFMMSTLDEWGMCWTGLEFGTGSAL